MPELQFKVEATYGEARLGSLHTPHGDIETPVFMPVGTQATVKSVLPEDVLETGSRIILSNAYHLFLRPGSETVRSAGGLHRFMNWPGAILTDSGGFQIMSLGHMVKVDDGGASFRSHIDGRPIRYTPKDSVRTQVDLGSDIIMCLDQLVTYPVRREEAAEAVRRTTVWAREQREMDVPEKQALFGIVQGSTYKDLRERSARELSEMDFPGYALGGFSVGEPKTEFYDCLAFTTALLPPGKPRYLMGVGHPVDLIEGALHGVDMFDCVLPTRNARHGRAFTFEGPLNMRNAAHAGDERPMEQDCDCLACRGFSRSYIRHLLVAEETLASTLITVHNLRFFQRFMERLRLRIRQGSAREFRSEMERLYPVSEKKRI
ncbi:MAG: tRNA guanosine(34) transglycosylase Tgt [Bacillota bacterium]